MKAGSGILVSIGWEDRQLRELRNAEADHKELHCATQALAQLIADLAAEDTFFSNPR
jgi:hypothetical protein